jgi:hypothetical protein
LIWVKSWAILDRLGPLDLPELREPKVKLVSKDREVLKAPRVSRAKKVRKEIQAPKVLLVRMLLSTARTF